MRRRGFTLIEILIAAALASVVLMLTASVMSAAFRSRERLQGAGGELSGLRRAYETISRDLHSAVVPPDDSGLQFGLQTGAGTAANVLQFAAVVSEPMLAGRAANETSLVQYAVADDPSTGRPTLWRYETPYPVPEGTDPTQSGETRALPLLPGVSGANYLFYSASQATWVESWEGETGLPSAIRIDLALGSNAELQEGGGRQESWVFTLPAAKFANEEAEAAAAAAEAGTTGTGAAQ